MNYDINYDILFDFRLRNVNFLKTESHTRKFRVFESNFESDTKNFRVMSRESGFLLERIRNSEKNEYMCMIACLENFLNFVQRAGIQFCTNRPAEISMLPFFTI